MDPIFRLICWISPLSFLYCVKPQGSGLRPLSSLQSLARCQDVCINYHLYPKDSPVYSSSPDTSLLNSSCMFNRPLQINISRTELLIFFPKIVLPLVPPIVINCIMIHIVFQAPKLDIILDSLTSHIQSTSKSCRVELGNRSKIYRFLSSLLLPTGSLPWGLLSWIIATDSYYTTCLPTSILPSLPSILHTAARVSL